MMVALQLPLQGILHGKSALEGCGKDTAFHLYLEDYKHDKHAKVVACLCFLYRTNVFNLHH